jgi:hypothetical protein
MILSDLRKFIKIGVPVSFIVQKALLKETEYNILIKFGIEEEFLNTQDGEIRSFSSLDTVNSLIRKLGVFSYEVHN